MGRRDEKSKLEAHVNINPTSEKLAARTQAAGRGGIGSSDVCRG